MTILTRELAITYGGVTFGAGTDRMIHDAVLSTRGDVLQSIEFGFVIAGLASAAAFAAEIATVEAALSKPRQDCTITMGGSTLYTLAHTSSMSGFDAKPTIIHQNDNFNSGRSRHYRVRIDFGVPNAINDGRRDAQVAIAYDESRLRQVTITGTWTTYGGSSARDAYNSGIAAFCTAVLDAVGGTYDLIRDRPINDDASRSSNDDTEGRLLQFERVYQEVGFERPSIDGLIDQKFSMEKVVSAGGESPERAGVRHIEHIRATYSAFLDRNAMPAPPTLESAGETIKAWILAQAKARWVASSTAMIESRVRPQYETNRIEVEALIEVAPASLLLDYKREVELEYNVNDVLMPVTARDRLAAYEHPAPSVVLQTITETFTETGRKRYTPFGFIQPEQFPGIEAWSALPTRVTSRQERRGDSRVAGGFYDVTIVTRVSRYRGFNQAVATGAVIDVEEDRLLLGD